MKAIIYTTEQEAQDALEICNEIQEPAPTFVGEGPFVERTPKPYTEIKKHPVEDLWALMANAKVEQAIGKTAEELGGDWFPETRSISIENE